MSDGDALATVAFLLVWSDLGEQCCDVLRWRIWMSESGFPMAGSAIGKFVDGVVRSIRPADLRLERMASWEQQRSEGGGCVKGGDKGLLKKSGEVIAGGFGRVGAIDFRVNTSLYGLANDI